MGRCASRAVACPGIFLRLAILKIGGTFLLGMKTKIIIWAGVLLVAQSAIGQVSTNFLFRYRYPIANDTLRCDLTPLYAWWAEQLDAAQKVQSAGEQSANGMGYATNVMERPMAPWFHITGEIVKEDPQGWIVNAMVEFAPGKGNPVKILLIHPPRKEIERFAEKRNFLNNPPPPPDYSSREAQIKAQNDRAFVVNALGDPDLADAYLADATQARRELDAQKARDQSIEAEKSRALDGLGDFPPDWQTYRADVFALNTGRQLYGLPVFDAGLSFAK